MIVCTGALLHAIQVPQEAVNPFAFVFETLGRVAVQWRIVVGYFALDKGNRYVVLENLEEGKSGKCEQKSHCHEADDWAEAFKVVLMESLSKTFSDEAAAMRDGLEKAVLVSLVAEGPS